MKQYDLLWSKEQLIETIERLSKENLDLEQKLSYRSLQVKNRNMQIKDLKKDNHRLQMELNQLYRDIEKAKKY